MAKDHDFKLLKIKLQQQVEASSYLNDMLEHHADLDSKTIHLIKIALAIQEGSDLHIEKRIVAALHDGVPEQEIKSAACLGLSTHNGSMIQHLKPVMDAINIKERKQFCRSTCFWNEDY